ncbi:alpha/beta hydrolase family protein [Treponema pedis]|uniref:alpha/beta hydrolase family protein n=1 Tax=Treponema pedis TaxID=409322 RepID=UPI0004229B5D|nr:alpha/beta fold hydrolase [Treponema pedis]
MKKVKSKKKRVFIIISCVLILLLGGWGLLAVNIYNSNLNKRFKSYESLMLHVEDFEGLQRTKYEFSSDKGQMLTGYMYSAGDNQCGIIVIAHGFGGGGHNSYMDCANYFAQHGYYVFAYDATGNDESEGAGVGGIPQGVIDLDYAISFLEKSGKFPALPISLFGHSWGGYSVCSVLTYHPEIKAVIEISGCNRSSDLFEASGKREAGKIIYTMMPFIKFYELIKYGKYARNTAMDGFKTSKAAVMIVHSADDNIVPASYGYDLYYNKYNNNPRFTFIRFENKGHNEIFTDSNDTYLNEFNTGFNKWTETLNYDYKADANKAQFAADKAKYINDNLDRTRWCGRLDEKLFKRFLNFYDEHVRR